MRPKTISLETTYWAGKRACADLLEEIGRTGVLQLARIMRDPARRCALAMLEGDGLVVHCGEPDAQFVTPYRLVGSDERPALLDARREAHRAEITGTLGPVAQAAARNAKRRQGGP